MRHVRVFKRGDRGFHGYGRPIIDANGGTVTVYESSSAEKPHVWLNIDAWAWLRESQKNVSAHLTREQALALIARLQTWVDEIPQRWARRRPRIQTRRARR